MEEQQSSQKTRRSLLARALRLSLLHLRNVTSSIMVARYSMLKQKLSCIFTVESEMNVGCTQPEDGRVFILVSSSLLESFDHDELCFVVGHELGHHIYNHHSIPLSLLLANHRNLSSSIASTPMATSC